MNMRAVLVVEPPPPPPPLNPRTSLTSGSCLITATTSWSFSCIAWNEISWAARIMPVSRPTSCSGKKPLGMYMYRPMLSTKVSRVRSTMKRECRRAQPRLTS